MLSKWLYKFAARLPLRVIPKDGRPYLERYYLGSFAGVTFYLHRFLAADGEAEVHNHPWRHSLALVLSGGYTELRAVDLYWGGIDTMPRRVSWSNVIKGHDFHQIIAVKPHTWTLFAHGGRRVTHGGFLKGWGFLRPVGHSSGAEFVPMESPLSQWWKDAPKGADHPERVTRGDFA